MRAKKTRTACVNSRPLSSAKSQGKNNRTVAIITKEEWTNHYYEPDLAMPLRLGVGSDYGLDHGGTPGSGEGNPSNEDCGCSSPPEFYFEVGPHCITLHFRNRASRWIEGVR